MKTAFDIATLPHFARYLPAVAAVLLAGLIASGANAAETDDSRSAIDWQSTDQIRWDPETRRLVVDERAAPGSEQVPAPEQSSRPAQPEIRWDSLNQIRWDRETQSFVTTERTAASQPGTAFDARNYQLSVRDQVEIQVFGEADLNITQRIDGAGQIRIPLLGNHRVTGLSVREAEDFIENLYVENRILRNPIVTVRVVEYAPREVAILGAVGRPGTQDFPIERNDMDIVEVVARAGGFTGIARSNAVSVTRQEENGRERTYTVDVESMITGSRRDGTERFKILPGDVIWVRERVF